MLFVPFFWNEKFTAVSKLTKKHLGMLFLLSSIFQGVAIAISATLLFLFIIVPQVQYLGNQVQNALRNANFTTMTIENGQLSTDIKPQVYTYYIENTEMSQYVCVIDNTGQLNPHFWDDRIANGKTVTINGIGLLKDHVLFKDGEKRTEIPYSQLFSKTVTFDKAGAEGAIAQMVSTSFLMSYWALILPIFAIAGATIGVIFHVIWAFIVKFLTQKFAIKKSSQSSISKEAIFYAAVVVYIQFFTFLWILGTGLFILLPAWWALIALKLTGVVLLGVCIYALGRKLTHDFELDSNIKNEP